MRSDLRFKASFHLFQICCIKWDRLCRNGAGGDWIINMEDEVRPLPVTDTQYMVCCVGADRETGRSMPHLTLGSEQGPGACGLPMSPSDFTIRRTPGVTVNPP